VRVELALDRGERRAEQLPAGSERGHGSPRRTGPQGGGDWDVDEAAGAVGCESVVPVFVARDAGMKWCRPAR